MLKRIFGELPEWATRNNPLLRYEIGRNQPEVTQRARIARIGLWVLLLALLLLGGYGYATNGFQRGLQMPYTRDIWRILFYPVLILQVVMRGVGLSLGVAAVSDARRRRTWDDLRSTETGTELSLRTRWVSVLFYRLRGLLFPVLAARVLLIVAILYELTSFQGRYLDLVIGGVSPHIALEIGVLLLAALMTAAMLLPITATGVDVALGLLISTAVRSQAYAAVLQILAIAFRIVSAGFLLLLMFNFQAQSPTDGAASSWLLVGSNAAFGDWGLSLLQFELTGEIWRTVPYSVVIGLALLLITLLQVALTDGILKLAVHIAERNE